MPYVDESKVTEWTNRLKSYFALLTHSHAASDITSGTLGVARGGTGGTTALDARKNLSVPVDSSIAYVESTTATKNHTAGDYFMLGSVLMKATAAIATGEQITASKATPVTIQSQIDTLRDSVGRIQMAGMDRFRIGYGSGQYLNLKLGGDEGYTLVAYSGGMHIVANSNPNVVLHKVNWTV